MFSYPSLSYHRFGWWPDSCFHRNYPFQSITNIPNCTKRRISRKCSSSKSLFENDSTMRTNENIDYLRNAGRCGAHWQCCRFITMIIHETKFNVWLYSVSVCVCIRFVSVCGCVTASPSLTRSLIHFLSFFGFFLSWCICMLRPYAFKLLYINIYNMQA